VVADLGRKSRFALGKGLHKASEHVASLNGEAIVAQADKVSSLAKASATVFDWQKSGQTPVLRLELIAQSANEIREIGLPAIDMETGEAV
jgi:hypothetical protein